MKIYRNQVITKFIDRGGQAFDGLRFESCGFRRCGIGLNAQSIDRTRIRNVEMINCMADGCECGPAAFDDVVVESLKTGDMLIIWGAIFRRLTFRGNCGSIKINQEVGVSFVTPKSIQLAFERDRRQFYRGVDWALDISHAQFDYFECRSVPANLVRRNPESQAVVRREKALDISWRQSIHRCAQPWLEMIDFYLVGDAPVADLILVIPADVTEEEYQRRKDGLKNLRELGVAEWT